MHGIIIFLLVIQEKDDFENKVAFRTNIEGVNFIKSKISK